MLDYIKVYSPNKENLENHIKSLYDVTCSVDYCTGEINYPCRTYFENIEVRVTEKYSIVRNSIHKFFNLINYNQSNNYTDFYLNDIKSAINTLSEKAGENIDDYKVTNLEFGLNIQTSLPAEKILKNNFLMYNFDGFNQIDTFKNKGYYKQYNRSEYYIKFYDKAKQFNLPYNLLRAEIKIIDSKLLKKFGIYTVRDLTNTSILKALFQFLLDCIEETNIIDTFVGENIPAKDKMFLELGKNPSYWLALKENKSASSYYEIRRKYNRTLSNYNLLTVKEEIKSLLIQKFKALIQESEYCEVA